MARSDAKSDVEVKIDAVDIDVEIKALPSIEYSRLEFLVGGSHTSHVWAATQQLKITAMHDLVEMRIHARDAHSAKVSSRSVKEFVVAIRGKSAI